MEQYLGTSKTKYKYEMWKENNSSYFNELIWHLTEKGVVYAVEGS